MEKQVKKITGSIDTFMSILGENDIDYIDERESTRGKNGER